MDFMDNIVFWVPGFLGIYIYTGVRLYVWVWDIYIDSLDIYIYYIYAACHTLLCHMGT